MRRQAVHALLLAALALTCTVLYGWWASSRINAPLGLDHFDEAFVRARVQATAQHLLENPGRFDLRLTEDLDVDKIRRMQQLFGIRAASYWSRKQVPLQRWIYHAYPPQKLSDFRLFKEREPPLTVEVDSSGQILALSIPHPESSHGHVTVSIGCASLIPDRNNSTELLYERADQALYRSKRSGRNRVMVWRPEL